jgi:hypothetical protein
VGSPLSGVWRSPESENLAVFGSATGAAILRRNFASVERRDYVDSLRCTVPDDVIAFLTSAPPGEDASPEQMEILRRAVQKRFDAENGVFTISKEVGLFIGRRPLR